MQLKGLSPECVFECVLRAEAVVQEKWNVGRGKEREKKCFLYNSFFFSFLPPVHSIY